jgi:pimeloyl-ACP methyl ester carboxylesterase
LAGQAVRNMLAASVLVVLVGCGGAVPAGSVSPPPTTGPSSIATPSMGADVAIGNGRHLHLVCQGQAPVGAPTVIIETGLGGVSTEWREAQAEMSASTRVCAYDRAGLGQSASTGEASRTSAELVADLHALLTAATIRPPYVLVGHSTGAWQVSLFAATYPNEVAGAIYVDPRNPATSSAWLSALGPSTLGEPEAVTSFREDLRAFEGDPSQNPEHVDLVASAAQALAVEKPVTMLFGAKPVVVLGADGDADDFADLPADIGAALMRVFTDGYQAYVHESSRGSFSMVADSSHAIFADQPAAIVEALNRVLAAIAGT